jgi:hypothetical protein
MVCGGTLLIGFRHALKKTKTAPLFLIAFSALAGNICEGVLIDSDHWRHFYLLMALVWGMMAASERETRKARIIADCGLPAPQSLQSVPPPRRRARTIAAHTNVIELNVKAGSSGKIPEGEMRRHAVRGRIVTA